MRPSFLHYVAAVTLLGAPWAGAAELTPREQPLVAYNSTSASHRIAPPPLAWPQVPYLRVSPAHATQLGPVLFPPEPPAAGAALPVITSATNAPQPPAELAGFLEESFYAALSMRLTATDPAQRPTDLQRAALDSYRADKTALQAELLATIDTLRDADATTRARSLSHFASQQTPRIVRLENTAEQLRREFTPADLTLEFEAVTTSPDLATWPVNVLRAAAFLQEGLSPAQRRLLREIAADSADKDSSPSPPDGLGAAVFLAPEPARVRLPAQAPASLVTQLATYTHEKAALKNELASALATRDPAARVQALATLAEKQAPRFAALEDAAEAIRRNWAALSDPALPPDLPQVPPELEARIAAYRRDKLDLQKNLLARVNEVQRGAPAIEPPPPQVQEKVRSAIAAFTEQNAARYTALEHNRESIRSDLARLSAAAVPAAASTSADALLRRFSTSWQQWQTWRNYHYYQIAVLQPGLSPEQRRLLFDIALGRLPLPPPEGIQPTD